MKMRAAIAIGALLTLAACGDDQKAAKAPDNTNTAAKTTESASTPAATPAPAAPPPAASSTASAPAGSTASEPVGSTTASSSTAQTTQSGDAVATATTSPGTSGATQASAPAGGAAIDSADDLKGRNFSAGRLKLQFPDSQRFVMTDSETNDKIEGSYRVEKGALVLSDPKGDAVSGAFPMRCDIQSSAADAFKLTDTDGSCAKLKDQSFKTAGG